eukprot:3941026-Rhodomonas_salina.2
MERGVRGEEEEASDQRGAGSRGVCVFVASNAENRDSFHPMRREKRGRVSFLLSDDVQDVREAGK